MPDTATAIGPVVRMCDDPDCHGLGRMPRREHADGPRGQLPARDQRRQGRGPVRAEPCPVLLRRTPPAWRAWSRTGAEFLLHKSAYAAAGTIGQYRWTAVYSGAGGTIDEVLAGAPEYEASTDLVHDRLRRMREAGVFDAALRERTPGG